MCGARAGSGGVPYDRETLTQESLGPIWGGGDGDAIDERGPKRGGGGCPYLSLAQSSGVQPNPRDCRVELGFIGNPLLTYRPPGVYGTKTLRAKESVNGGD